MVPQSFAVAPGQDYLGLARDPSLPQLMLQPADLGVEVGHLPVVGFLIERGLERLGRIVVVVRIVEVEPEEERPVPGNGIHEREPLSNDLLGPALLRSAGEHLANPGYFVVVEIEAPAQAAVGVEVERPEDGPGAVAGRAQNGRQRRHVLAEPGHQVVSQPVMDRVKACQDRRHRGSRRGRGGVGPIEADSARGEGVDRGGDGAPARIAAEPVRAQALDGDQQDVRPAAAGAGRRLSSPARRSVGESERYGEGGDRPDRARGLHFSSTWIFFFEPASSRAPWGR